VWIAIAVTGAASLLNAQGHREQARLLLHELDSAAVQRTFAAYAWCLTELVRSAVAVGDHEVAGSLAAGVRPATPCDQYGLMSCQAQLAEANGNHTEAASLYADAAHRWNQFGNVPEHAYSLLGQGRCLRALGDPAGQQPLAEARELFASMGYNPALAETDSLLAESQPAAS
jgi:hypothetical protein